MFGSFGWVELLLILVIVLIIFGAGKLPQLGEGIGKAIKGFKRSIDEPEPVENASTARMEAPPTRAEAAGPEAQRASRPPGSSRGASHDSSHQQE